MAYIVNRYNGTQLVVVEDGTIDQTTDIKLIGKNYSGYGEAIGVQPVHWTARSIARDFDRLMFQTEWGESVPRLLKWEKPATISLSTPELASYRPFLDDLVTRIRNAAPGLDVSATGGPNADITLRSAPRTEMDEIAANALCFFIPHDVTWAEFKSLDARDAAGLLLLLHRLFIVFIVVRVVRPRRRKRPFGHT